MIDLKRKEVIMKKYNFEKATLSHPTSKRH
jgi:hypothetical protein